jgi:hypothetical protein
MSASKPADSLLKKKSNKIVMHSSPVVSSCSLGYIACCLYQKLCSPNCYKRIFSTTEIEKKCLLLIGYIPYSTIDVIVSIYNHLACMNRNDFCYCYCSL